MRKILAALAASGVLVAGAFTAVTITDSGTAFAQEATDESSTEAPVRPHKGEIMDEVLSDLVAGDVISQDQADQIKAAFEAKAEELREQFGDRDKRRGPGFRDGFRRGFNFGGLLEDGVIDADELAELGPDHPLNDPDGPAADYLEGGLTTEELREIGEQLREQRRSQAESNATETGSSA